MNNDIVEEESFCAFCEHAAPLRGEEYVLCEKKGVVRASFVCRKFAYDPLKHRPPTHPLPTLVYVDMND